MLRFYVVHVIPLSFVLDQLWRFAYCNSKINRVTDQQADTHKPKNGLVTPSWTCIGVVIGGLVLKSVSKIRYLKLSIDYYSDGTIGE